MSQSNDRSRTPLSGSDATRKSVSDKSEMATNASHGREQTAAKASLDKALRSAEQQRARSIIERSKQRQVDEARQSHDQGDRAERQALKVLKDMGYHQSGLGLHYGRQGLDAYGIRNTPKGKTVGRMEVKSTRDPSRKGSPEEVTRLLKTDSKGLQQGSKGYGQDRILESLQRDGRVARNIRSGQARAGEGRIWQSRDYVYWTNAATGDNKVYRVTSSADGSKVQGLRLAREWSKEK